MAKKSTNADIENRVLTVYQMLIEAYSYMDIVRYCKKAYNVTSSRTVYKYITAATEMLKKENKKTAENLRAEATARYQRWIRKCEGKENYKTAGFMQSRLDKINGLESYTINHEIDKLEDIMTKINDIK